MYYTTEEALQYIINDSLMNDQGFQKSNLVYWLRETTQRNGLNTILKIMFNLQKSVAIKGAVGSADLKISKSASLSLNHHNFSNTTQIYTG